MAASIVLAISTLARALYLAIAAVPVNGLSLFDLAPAIALFLPLSFLTAYCGLPRTTLALRGCCAYGLVLAYAPDMCATIFHTGRAFPMVDQALGALDQALGFDWMAYARCLDRQLLIWRIAACCYNSINYQPALILLALAWAGSARRLYAFCLAHALALTIVASVALFLPATGAFDYFDTAHAGFQHQNFATAAHWTKTIHWMREDAPTGRTIEYFSLISFPSFHAASAAIFAWATWRVPFVRWAGVLLNLGMLAATPVQGSHYLIDVIAGRPSHSLRSRQRRGSWIAQASSPCTFFEGRTGGPLGPQRLKRGFIRPLRKGSEAAPPIRLKKAHKLD